MANPKRKKVTTWTVGHHPPLDAWLTKRHARFLWRVRGEVGHPVVEGWAIGANLVLVTLYQPTDGERGGWDLFFEASQSNNIATTLTDADARLAASADNEVP